MDILQGKCFNQSHGINSYLELINKITNMNEVFKFLIENRFVGYLNYHLLKEFSSKVICGDRYKKAQAEIVEYEKHYLKFIEEPAFCQLIEVFDENPELNPGTVVGLPIVVISLSKKWKTRNKKDLNEWIPFLRENKHLLQSIGYKCILITYAIFPVHLLKVMRFLSNDEHIKILKENGITIKTPSYTMEIAERLREVSTEDSVKNESILDEMQRQYFLLLEKADRMQQEQLRIQQEQLRIQQEQLKDKALIQQLLEDIDLLMSDTQMKDRIDYRKHPERFNTPENAKKWPKRGSKRGSKHQKSVEEAHTPQTLQRNAPSITSITSDYISRVLF
uniref:Uncharacterized protein n=1 Tax=Amphimedon queenslandica TaxID=400682 RepID=A0A1X7SU92_AMPQE